MAAASPTDSTPSRLRPRSYTVFAAAFLAGAAAAVGVNRVLDVHLAQRRPQVESEPIFVALRPLPQGAPVTVWDVALKDWPKAMLPSSALRAGDSFEGFILRHAIREGQPLLAIQLIRSGSQVDGAAAVETFVPAVPAVAATARAESAAPGDLWTPAAATTPPTAAGEIVTAEPAESVVAADTGAAGPEGESRTDAGVPQPTVASPQEPRDVVVAAPVVAATEPMPTTEPVPTAVDPPVAPSPVAAVGTTPPQPTLAVEDADAVSEAVATDVATMPSVMTQPATVGTVAAQPQPGDAGRYLVVPERIALQADTSFTTPRPQPPGPPAAGRQGSTAKPRTPPRTAGQADAGRGTPSAPPQRPHTGPAPRSRQQQPSRDAKSSATRPWAPFSGITAGLEALGGPWQRGGSTATRPQGGDAARR